MNKPSLNIEDYKIGAPAHRALAGARISTLKELSKFTENEINSLHGVGPKAIIILKKAMKDIGLAFKK